jgi:hypothetical protein
VVEENFWEHSSKARKLDERQDGSEGRFWVGAVKSRNEKGF